MSAPSAAKLKEMQLRTLVHIGDLYIAPWTQEVVWIRAIHADGTIDFLWQRLGSDSWHDGYGHVSVSEAVIMVQKMYWVRYFEEETDD